MGRADKARASPHDFLIALLCCCPCMHAVVIVGLALVRSVKDGRTGVHSRHVYLQQVLHTCLHSTASAGDCHKNQQVIHIAPCYIAAGVSNMPRTV